MKIRAFVCLVLASWSVLGLAQTPTIDPPAELKKLDWYIGEWTGKVKWSMPGMPPTDEEMSIKNVWDGQFIKSSSIMTMSGQKMMETSFVGWNAKTKKYDSYTFTNFAPTPRIEHGEMDGDKFAFTSDPWDVGGMEMIGRASMVKKSDKEFTFILEFKLGDKFEKVGEGSFKKK